MKRNQQFIGRKAMQAIEKEANDNLSNFDGYENDYEDDNYEDDYDGSGDDHLDFDGSNSTDASFRNEAANSRTIQFMVTNAIREGVTPARASFYLNPSFVNFNADGTRATGVAKEGTFNSIEGIALTAVGSQTTVDNFQRFVYRNPTRVVGMRLSATGADGAGPRQLGDMKIRIMPQSIFNQQGTKEIIPANFISETVMKDNVVTVPAKFQMDDQVAVLFTIEPGATLTINLMIGATVNNAKSLDRKVGRAKRNGVIKA
ncbi:hypothetical protein [Edaphocola aurantiacus]|uniref:hypothetical protein n=1 Tax=Edaphocola aurantiacus TaxID=2601682 RepID=UPI001C97CD85|nr:hypothetical protein [Edaphocola aurantiacus]